MLDARSPGTRALLWKRSISLWIESELKLLLPDAAAFERVRDALGDASVVSQKNHFFDRADGALRDARIGVRLRVEPESADSGPAGTQEDPREFYEITTSPEITSFADGLPRNGEPGSSKR